MRVSWLIVYILIDDMAKYMAYMDFLNEKDHSQREDYYH